MYSQTAQCDGDDNGITSSKITDGAIFFNIFTTKHQKYDKRPIKASLDKNILFPSLFSLVHRSSISSSAGTGAHKSIFVHTDFDQLPGVNDPVKLNFTWGPLDSVTRWWKIKDPSLYKKYTNTEVREEEMAAGVESAALCETIWVAKDEDVELVYEKVIDKPSLLNVGQLHSTFNPGNEDRWTWSFAMLNQNNEAISFNQALEIFKNIIYE